MKVGDKVTITMEVAETLGDMVFLICDGTKIRSRASGWMHVDDCKLLESYPVATELKVGDKVELKCNNHFDGAKGLITQRHASSRDGDLFWFEALDSKHKSVSGWKPETWESDKYGTCRLVKID